MDSVAPEASTPGAPGKLHAHTGDCGQALAVLTLTESTAPSADLVEDHVPQGPLIDKQQLTPDRSNLESSRNAGSPAKWLWGCGSVRRSGSLLAGAALIA
jgi:hypothetical protein